MKRPCLLSKSFLQSLRSLQNLLTHKFSIKSLIGWPLRTSTITTYQFYAVPTVGPWQIALGIQRTQSQWLSYRKVASSRLPQLVAHLRIFRLLMKGKFDSYVLWPLAKNIQNWIVDRCTARDFTVHKLSIIHGQTRNFQNAPMCTIRHSSYRKLS